MISFMRRLTASVTLTRPWRTPLLFLFAVVLLGAVPHKPKPEPWVYISQPATGFQTWIPISQYDDAGAYTYVVDPVTGLYTKLCGTHIAIQYYPNP